MLQIETSPRFSSALSEHIEHILNTTPIIESLQNAVELLPNEPFDLVIVNMNVHNCKQVQQLIELNLNVPMVLLCYTDLLRKHKHWESERIMLFKKPLKETLLYKMFYDLFPNRHKNTLRFQLTLFLQSCKTNGYEKVQFTRRNTSPNSKSTKEKCRNAIDFKQRRGTSTCC